MLLIAAIMQKLKKVMMVLGVVLVALLFVRWVLRMLSIAQGETKNELKQLRVETDLKLDKLRRDALTTIRAVHEENRKVTREIVDELREKTVLPSTSPKGLVGFGCVAPEAIV